MFLEERWYDRFFKSVVEITRGKWEINYVSASMSAQHSLRSQIGMGSESHCLLGQLNKILAIDFRCRLKSGEFRGSFGEEVEWGDDEVELLGKERRSLDILCVKKEARLSARALAEVQEGKGE